MAIFLEDIRFPPGQSMRLARWDHDCDNLEALETGGRRVSLRGAGSRWHSHPELELTVVTHGSGVRYVGDHVGPFGAVDCVLLGSHLPHCWLGNTFDGFVLQFAFPPEHPFWRVAGASALRDLTSAAEHGLQFPPETGRSTLRLLKRMAQAPTLARTGLLLELLSLLHADLAESAATLSSMRMGSDVDAASRPRLQATVQWILDNFAQPITLEEAVRRSSMSRATFCRQFRRYTGKTFVTFVNDARLAHSHQLLTQTTRPITEVAYASGFGSLSQFNATFRTRFGTNPRQVRRQAESRLLKEKLGELALKEATGAT